MTVEIYGSDDCPPCEKAKKYLEKRGVDYRSVDIEKDPEGKALAQSMAEEVGYCEVPIIIKDGKGFVGFDKKKIEELIT